jgi:hypothetical protein
MLFNVTVFWVCVGVCIARTLRLITATVTSIAAIIRTVGLASMVVITPCLPALWMTVNQIKSLVVSLFAAWAAVSGYRAELSVAPVADRRPAAFLTELHVYEPSRVRLGRSSEAISVRVNRRLLRSADRLVTGPIMDEGASSRS